jgi:hypothetical protein
MPEGELHFFLEFDRGAENLKFFKRKMDAYLTYFRSGKCNARYGMDKVRVLTVNEGGQTGVDRRRLVNLRRVTEEMGGRRRFFCRGGFSRFFSFFFRRCGFFRRFRFCCFHGRFCGLHLYH